ncbi:MAG: PPC domain-containing protein, partial [Dehalococcoidia bacterium]
MATEIPGTALALGSSRASMVDSSTKPRDVYAVSLVAGQEVQFSVTGHSSYLYFILANPGSTSFATSSYSQAFYTGSSSAWSIKFVPAVSGTYYFEVTATGSGQSYTIAATSTGVVYGDGSVATEIPGTALALGSSCTSVLDSKTKPRDVYAVSLVAGQEVQFSVTGHSSYLYFILANPGSTSFATSS